MNKPRTFNDFCGIFSFFYSYSNLYCLKLENCGD